jgi:hypothetical protein
MHIVITGENVNFPTNIYCFIYTMYIPLQQEYGCRTVTLNGLFILFYLIIGKKKKTIKIYNSTPKQEYSQFIKEN